MSAEAEIVVVPYDCEWPLRFQEEQAVLGAVLSPWLAGTIEHIGSTAVPGLPAKPVLDIMAGVHSLDASRPAIAVLASLSYCYFPYRPDAMHWFCKPSAAYRTHHLHLILYGSRLWNERIAFRNYLRTHPQLAQEYAELKQQLAARYRLDREAYTDAKGPFVERVVKLALGPKH
jgi:GrpB-like predicted nucleotidyltransferase (UPF0157 family)